MSFPRSLVTLAANIMIGTPSNFEVSGAPSDAGPYVVTDLVSNAPCEGFLTIEAGFALVNPLDAASFSPLRPRGEGLQPSLFMRGSYSGIVPKGFTDGALFVFLLTFRGALVAVPA